MILLLLNKLNCQTCFATLLVSMLRDDFRRIRAFNFHWKFAEQFIAIIDSNEHRRKVENNSERPSSKVLFTQALPSVGRANRKFFKVHLNGEPSKVFLFSQMMFALAAVSKESKCCWRVSIHTRLLLGVCQGKVFVEGNRLAQRGHQVVLLSTSKHRHGPSSINTAV